MLLRSKATALAALQAQPYFKEDIHAGSGDEVDLREHVVQRGGQVDEDAARNGRLSAIRLAYARSIGQEQFLGLVAKVLLLTGLWFGVC